MQSIGFKSPTLASIPFHHSGSRVDGLASEEDVAAIANGKGFISLSGKEYRVYHRYLVPYYEPTEHESSRRNQQLVIDRVRRFFYTAEPELDIPLTRLHLEQEMVLYQQCTDPGLKEIKGRFLVGEMMNRMGRLAQVICQRNMDGIEIEIFHEKGNYELTDAQIADCEKEFAGYYSFLLVNEETPLRFMRLRDRSPDYDGLLADLVREIGKPIKMPETMVYSGILTKIGQAMEAIDETYQVLKKLISQPKLQAAVVAAQDKMDYTTILEEFTDLCRARAGLRRQDYDNFNPVRERIAYLSQQLGRVHQLMKTTLHTHDDVAIGTAQSLLVRGVEVMHEMAIARYPRNHSALYGDMGRMGNDLSSVGRLTAAVDFWCSDFVGEAARAG